VPSAGLAEDFRREPNVAYQYVLQGLMEEGVLVRRGDFIASSAVPADLSGELLAEARRIVGLVEAAGLQGAALPLPGVRREDMEALAAREMVFTLEEDLVTTPGMLTRVEEIAREAFGEGEFRLGEFREALGVSRKFALMWAEIMDNRGLTRRQGEIRRLCPSSGR
jgi:hypothetical protein